MVRSIISNPVEGFEGNLYGPFSSLAKYIRRRSVFEDIDNNGILTTQVPIRKALCKAYKYDSKVPEGFCHYYGFYAPKSRVFSLKSVPIEDRYAALNKLCKLVGFGMSKSRVVKFLLKCFVIFGMDKHDLKILRRFCFLFVLNKNIVKSISSFIRYKFSSEKRELVSGLFIADHYDK